MVAARRLLAAGVTVPGWLLLAAAATVLAGVVELGGQQKLRHDADHPQVEMARQAVAQLDRGTPPAAVVGSGRADLAASLDPWMTVMDARGMPLASSGVFLDLPPIPPSGVFDWVRAHGEDTITWQPAPGVRNAIVVDRYRAGFVVAGRSLRVVEENEDSLLRGVVIGWLAAIAALGGLSALQRRAAA